MKSIYFKNFLATAIMVLVSFLMIGVAFVFIGQGYIIKSHRDNMESNARVISRLTTSLVYEEGLTDLRLRILLNGTSLISGNHIFITNDEGLIISCSDELGRCQHLGRSVDASYINTLEQQGSLDIVTDLGGLFSSQRYVFAMAMTVADSGAPVGYIFVSTDRSTIMGAWSAFIWVFFAVTLAVLFLALVLSLVVSKKMAEPLDEMTAAARRFAHGDFSVRVREDKGTDELAALLGGVVLFVSNLNWLDPQITPLVPVLKSYWLMIHVSVVTASYGFFGICAACGIASLAATAFGRNLRELRAINEMAMIVGLALLTAGIFFGAVWANESWGRYWGWDPKETWALITMFAYALATHSRHIPRLDGPFAFDVLSVVCFSTVLMTFFGVNYYLSGLHSYGHSGGVSLTVPLIGASVVIALIAAAAGRYFKTSKKR